MWIDIAILLVRAVLPIVLMLIIVPGLIWLERRFLAWMQSRLGPNRVGPQGLLQPVADILKLLLKEETRPLEAEWFLFSCAPAIAVITSFMAFAAIPLGAPITIGGRQVLPASADIEIGLLYVLAVTSLGVYGIVIGGWAGNSKYSILGGMRSAAQMISYELSLGLSLIPVVLVSGSLRPSAIVQAQPVWFGVPLFLAAATFFISSLAETNRAPFDLPEAEQELVAGFNTEYSSLRFGLFFLAEYANMVTAIGLFVTCFLGGWAGPVFGPVWLRIILPFVWFFAKMLVLILVFMWLRATFPRFRYDQLMFFGWKVLLPVTALNALVVAAVVTLVRGEAVIPLLIAEAAVVAVALAITHRIWARHYGWRPRKATLTSGRLVPDEDSAAAQGGEGGAA